MRIRKHASKILGTASSLPPPHFPPPSAVDASSSGYICVLNQSPWDVFLSPPHNPQEEEEISIADSIKGESIKGEETISVDTRSNTTVVKRVKRKRVTVNKENGYADSDSTVAAPTYSCKKTDGKQWRCRRPAHKPNSLCDYHLEQIKSYSYRAPSVAKAARVHKITQKKRTTRPAATSVVSDIYYYTSFGPWRGKQRGGGDVSQDRPVAATADGESDNEGESCDYMDVSEDEESWEGSELEEKQKRSETDPLMVSRKKRRKPVKARSLKSLM